MFSLQISNDTKFHWNGRLYNSGEVTVGSNNVLNLIECSYIEIHNTASLMGNYLSNIKNGVHLHCDISETTS